MPTRTCVGCRTSAEKRELVRIVAVDGEYRVDDAQILPGRGAYLHPGCGARALRTRAIPRALRADAGSTPQLMELLADLEAAPEV